MTQFARATSRLLMLSGIVALAAAACTAGGGGGANSAAEPVPGRSAPARPAIGAPPGGGDVAVMAGVPQVGPSIVKTARLSIQVKRGGFQEAYDRASSIAGEQGGFVESSSTEGAKVRSGRLTLRVPADRFEAALSEIAGLGDIRLRSVTGRDVTSRFVDLAARIRNARAQEQVLLGILHTATTVTGTLQVQRTLSDVQLQIEELVGQQRSLQNQAALGTIQVELFEPGLPAHRPAETAGIGSPQLSEAWDRAKAVFFGMIYGIVVSLGVLLPLGALALLALLVWRRARARQAGAEA
ncbi:MAG: DUF4349 domain-containing protein [Actinomycetota bacterium]